MGRGLVGAFRSGTVVLVRVTDQPAVRAAAMKGGRFSRWGSVRRIRPPGARAWSKMASRAAWFSAS